MHATCYLIHDPYKDLYLRYTPTDDPEDSYDEWVKLDQDPTFWQKEDAEVHRDTLLHPERTTIMPVYLELGTPYQPED